MTESAYPTPLVAIAGSFRRDIIESCGLPETKRQRILLVGENQSRLISLIISQNSQKGYAYVSGGRMFARFFSVRAKQSDSTVACQRTSLPTASPLRHRDFATAVEDTMEPTDKKPLDQVRACPWLAQATPSASDTTASAPKLGRAQPLGFAIHSRSRYKRGPSIFGYLRV